MPKEWSKKDEKQYKRIVDSEMKQGKSAKEAEKIASATVNKQRKKEGRTKS